VETRRVSERADDEALVDIPNAAIPDHPVGVGDHLGFLRLCREHESFLVLELTAVGPPSVEPHLRGPLA
jgi:hypothetical protein